MASVRPVLFLVSSSATSSSSMTLPHSFGRRPHHTTRTFLACSSSRWRRSTSRVKFMRKWTSEGLRFQFSVENAYAESHSTPPSSMHASTASMSFSSPTLWPSVRFRPRCCAQRPLPSITNAMCFGMNFLSILGAPMGVNYACSIILKLFSPVSRLNCRCATVAR